MNDLWQERFGIPRPGKLICVGLNYHDHAREGSLDLPNAPLLFGKFSNTVIGAGEAIRLPACSEHVDAEAELAVVIGKLACNISAKNALDYIAGYTVANDVSARDLQFADGQWFRGKGFDTFCPLLATLVSPRQLGDGSGLRISQRLNGTPLQDSCTSELIFDVPQLVAYSSSICTLEPGDVILTGTPSGVGYFRDPKAALKPGDSVEIEIEGIGLLSNPVL